MASPRHRSLPHLMFNSTNKPSPLLFENGRSDFGEPPGDVRPKWNGGEEMSMKPEVYRHNSDVTSHVSRHITDYLREACGGDSNNDDNPSYCGNVSESSAASEDCPSLANTPELLRRPRSHTFTGDGAFSTVRGRLRKAREGFRGSVGSLMYKVSNRRSCESLLLSKNAGDRMVRVEFTDRSDKHKNRPASMESHSDDEEVLDIPDRNYTSHLLITALRDGMFSSEIDLDNLPKEDITIRVHGYKLEVIVNPRVEGHHSAHSAKRTHKMAVPYHCGVIHLPMFIDPRSLKFSHESARNVLIVEGAPKGALAATCVRSLSVDNLTKDSQLSPKQTATRWRKLKERISVSNDNIVKFWKTHVTAPKDR